MTKFYKNSRYATTLPQATQQQSGAGAFSPALSPAGSGSTTLQERREARQESRVAGKNWRRLDMTAVGNE